MSSPLLCANQIVSDDEKAPSSFSSSLLVARCPELEGITNRCCTTMFGAHLFTGAPLVTKKKWIELYDMSFNRIHWEPFKASVSRGHFHWRRKLYAFEIPTWSSYDGKKNILVILPPFWFRRSAFDSSSTQWIHDETLNVLLKLWRRAREKTPNFWFKSLKNSTLWLLCSNRHK